MPCHHNFALRKVAGAAGVQLGNLQYYFSTKNKLVEALFDRAIQGYVAQ
jgi:AcrR family transcriptional regulator